MDAAEIFNVWNEAIEQAALKLAWSQNMDPRTEMPLDTERNRIIRECMNRIRALKM